MLKNLKLVHSASTQPPSPTPHRMTPQSIGLSPVHNRIECCGEPLGLDMMFIDMEKSRSFTVGDKVYIQLYVPCIFCYEERSVLFRGSKRELSCRG